MSKREITKEEEKKILKIIKENEKLKKENKKLKDEINQLKDDIGEYDEENDDLKGKILSLEEDMDNIEGKWNNTLAELGSTEDEWAQSLAEIDDLRQELNDLRLEKNQELIQNIKNMPRIQYPYSKYDPVKFPSSTIHKKNRLNTEIDDDVIDELMETYTTKKQNILLDDLKAQDFIPFKNTLKKSKKLEEEELEDFEL
jgi:chromosome segregation ATPase